MSTTTIQVTLQQNGQIFEPDGTATLNWTGNGSATYKIFADGAPTPIASGLTGNSFVQSIYGGNVSHTYSVQGYNSQGAASGSAIAPQVILVTGIVALSDVSGSKSIVRTDTNALVAPTPTVPVAGEPATAPLMTRISKGVYQYTVTDPPGATAYQIFYCFYLNNIPYWLSGTKLSSQYTPIGTPSAASNFYLRQDQPPVVQNSTPTLQWNVLDSNGAAISLAGKQVRLVAYQDTGTAEIPIFQHDTTDGSNPVTISGSSNNLVSVKLAAGDSANPGGYYYWLWNISDLVPLAHGRLPILRAPLSV